MINLYSGTPGSGKSLHLARLMKNWIHLYRAPVIGNFSFNAAMCKPRGWGSYLEVTNAQLQPDFLIAFSRKYQKLRKWSNIPEEHILLVIDECQLLFNAREWNKANRAAWISFFTQHRKLGYRIVLVAQFDRMIDRQIRSLIEYEFVHRKVKNIGFKGKLLSFCAGGGLHVAVEIYKPLNEKVGSSFFKANRQLFALYDSYTTFTDA